MTSSEYWKKREADALKSYQKDEEAYYEEIQEIYADMMERIQKEIDSFYIKYAVKEDISMAEAKKRVSQLDIKAYARKAKKYVRNRDFSDKANEEMRLYNATMKINRLEMLKANIGLELVSGYDELQKYFEQTLTDRTLDEFKRQAGILGETITDNAEMVHSIVDASFHNATFSDRIWMHQDVLKNQLSSLLQTGLIQGRNPRRLAVELRKYFNVGIGNSERLMRTELARVQTAAQKRSFEKNGFEEYEFIANGTACEKCAGLDGQHFKVAKMMPGTNAPPMHPNCRCSTAAYQDSAEYEAWLDFLDKGGSTEEWQSLKGSGFFNNSEEKAIYAETIKRIGTNAVDLNYIKSESFRKKFNQITDNSTVNDVLRRYATAMLTHRNGTDGEDLYIIDTYGNLILRKISGKNELGVGISEDETNMLRKNYSDGIIGIHNHPTNILPTGSDFVAAGYRKYNFGIVATHEGKVYKYTVGNKAFLPRMLDDRIDKYTNSPYNLSIEKAHVKALNEMVKEYDITWQELQ